MPAKLSGDPKNWLLLKKRERRATRASGSEPQSPPRRSAPRYDPMLATLAKEVPRGKGWLHEVKWDGYRVVAYVEAGEATLFSRRRNPLTERFATVAAALPRAVRTPSAVLDGEVVTLDETGRASFSAMQQGGAAQLLYVFDVLEADGVPLLDLPFTERRARLAELLDPASRTVRLSEAFEDGEALFAAAKEQKLEGIVSKRADSRYEAGKRSRAWLKVKATGRQEFVIAGLHERRGPSRRAPSARSSSRCGTGTSFAGSATSAPGSARRRSSACSGSCASSSATRPRSPSRRRCRGSARGTSTGSSRSS